MLLRFEKNRSNRKVIIRFAVRHFFDMMFTFNIELYYQHNSIASCETPPVDLVYMSNCYFFWILLSRLSFFSEKGILRQKRGEFTRIHQPLPLRTLLKGSNNFGLIQKLFLNLEIDKDIISFIIVVTNLSYTLLFLRSGGFYYFLCYAFKSTGFCISENVLSSEKINRKTTFQEKKMKFWDNSWKPQLFYIKCWTFSFSFFQL